MIDQKQVIVERISSPVYPTEAPFSPDTHYPEYRLEMISTEPNPVYEGVRSCFIRAGLDSDNVNKPTWNPLADIINVGETVLLKPNMIKEMHPRESSGWRWVLTHGSIIRAVADYAWTAVGPNGRVIVADAPQTDSSFAAVVRILGLDQIASFYQGHGKSLDLIDLRQEEWENRNGVIVNRRSLAGDPAGDVAFDLGDRSEFMSHTGAGRFYGADYDAKEVNRHHTRGRHEYLLSQSVMDADVVFSLPKLKTHKKAGITVSLKNLVGVNADKNWLPHHTEARLRDGGDEHPNPSLKHRLERGGVAQLQRISLRFPRVGTWLHRRARNAGTHVFGDTEDVIRSGNWWGNDTVWRMCLDLNKIVSYGNPDGSLRPASPGNRRRHYSLVDGVIAGEGRGPMNPDPVEAGLLLFGLHPASVDATAAVLMGFDPDLIPIVRGAFVCEKYALTEWGWRDVGVISNEADWDSLLLPDIPASSTLAFAPHFGWVGHIEANLDAPR